MNASGLVVRTWNDAPISRRDSDGFADATAMCQANGKLWGHYRENERTAAYIQALAASLGIPADQLVITTTTGPNHLRGTWVHPRLAVDLARWLSPWFAVWMDGWFLEQLEQAASQSAIPQQSRTNRRYRSAKRPRPDVAGSSHLRLMARVHGMSDHSGTAIGWRDVCHSLSHGQRDLIEPTHFLAAIRDLSRLDAGNVISGARGALLYKARPGNESFPEQLELVDFPYALPEEAAA